MRSPRARRPAPLRAPGLIVAGDFAPDSRCVALASTGRNSKALPAETGGDVTCWDWQTGKPVFDRPALPAPPNDLCYSPDGTRLAVIGNQGQVVLLDPATGQVRANFQSSSTTQKSSLPARLLGSHRVGFDPTGKHLLAWGVDKEVWVWDLETGQGRTLAAKDTADRTVLSFSRDGRLCTSGGVVWDFASGRVLAMLPSHPATVFANKFSPDGERIATACRDGTVRLWDWRTGRLSCPAFQHQREAYDMVFTPDGRRLATIAWDRTVRLWDVQTGQAIAPPLAVPWAGWQLETDPGGQFLAACGEFAPLRVFDFQDMCRPADLPLNDLVTWCELVSEQRIHEGGNVVNLSPDEWLERWRSFRKRQPGRFDSLWSAESRLAWRRTEADDRATRAATLAASGRKDDAIVVYRQAVALWPGDAVQTKLGDLLAGKGQLKEAVGADETAVRLKPDSALYHYNLGSAQQRAGAIDQAIASYTKATHLDPDFAQAHCDLGNALVLQGRFVEALTARRRGHELGSKRPDWKYPSERWVKECQRLVELDVKLPDLVAGKIAPANAAERLELAAFCQQPCKQLVVAAVRFFTEAFAAEPALADNPRTFRRYNAACAAALAGCGQGKDVDKLDGAERARLRRQALDWLRADLEAWRRLLDEEPDKFRPVIAKQMRHWLDDPDFAGVRGPQALAELPEAERQPWQKLWDDVAKAQAKMTPAKKTGAGLAPSAMIEPRTAAVAKACNRDRIRRRRRLSLLGRRAIVLDLLCQLH